MQGVARDLYGDVREGILGLRTGPGDGLAAALRGYLDRYAEMSGLRVAFDVEPEAADARPAPAAEVQLMRVVQEALSNVRKHARARSVSVRFAREGGCLSVEIRDDGRGFDPTVRPSTGWPHFGLQTMRERAESVGGTLAVETTRGRGTRVTARVPVEREPVAAGAP